MAARSAASDGPRSADPGCWIPTFPRTPLLAVADRAGGDRPERARRAEVAIAAAGADDAKTARIVQLPDIRRAFAALARDRMSSFRSTAARTRATRLGNRSRCNRPERGDLVSQAVASGYDIGAEFWRPASRDHRGARGRGDRAGQGCRTRLRSGYQISVERAGEPDPPGRRLRPSTQYSRNRRRQHLCGDSDRRRVSGGRSCRRRLTSAGDERLSAWYQRVTGGAPRALLGAGRPRGGLAVA